jgi:hypothetical protein
MSLLEKVAVFIGAWMVLSVLVAVAWCILANRRRSQFPGGAPGGLCALLAFLALTGLAAAGDIVLPQSVTVTNFRGGAQAEYANATIYTQGDTILFTNCVAYSGTDTNSAVQGLDGVTPTLRIGTESTNVLYTGTVQVAAEGTYTVTGVIPMGAHPCDYLLRLIDANTNSYTYLKGMLHTARPLGQ